MNMMKMAICTMQNIERYKIWGNCGIKYGGNVAHYLHVCDTLCVYMYVFVRIFCVQTSKRTVSNPRVTEVDVEAEAFARVLCDPELVLRETLEPPSLESIHTAFAELFEVFVYVNLISNLTFEFYIFDRLLNDVHFCAISFSKILIFVFKFHLFDRSVLC